MKCSRRRLDDCPALGGWSWGMQLSVSKAGSLLAGLWAAGCAAHVPLAAPLAWSPTSARLGECPCVAWNADESPDLICSVLGLGDFRLNALPADADWALRVVLAPAFSSELVITVVGAGRHGVMSLSSPQFPLHEYCANAPDDELATDAPAVDEPPAHPPVLWQVQAEITGRHWADFVAQLDSLDLPNLPACGSARGFDGADLYVFYRDRRAATYLQRWSGDKDPRTKRFACALYELGLQTFGDPITVNLLNDFIGSSGVDATCAPALVR
jgi:hypothetical protein